jgi:hypothetical protein
MTETTPAVEKFGNHTLDYGKSKTYWYRLSDNKKVKQMGVTEGGDVMPPYPPVYILKNPVSTFDPVTKKPRIARCLKGVESIWVDEQDDLPEDFVKSNLDEIVFNYGDLHITWPLESTRHKFLLAHLNFQENNFQGIMPVFMLRNNDKEAEKEMEKVRLRNKALDKVEELTMEQMEELSTHYGISLTDGDGDKRRETAIRLDFARKAEENPDAFLKNVDNARVKIAHKIKTMIDNGEISLTHTKGQAHWGDTKAMITVLTEDEDAVDQLVEFAVGKGKKSADFIKRLGL